MLATLTTAPALFRAISRVARRLTSVMAKKFTSKVWCISSAEVIWNILSSPMTPALFTSPCRGFFSAMICRKTPLRASVSVSSQ